MSSIEYKLEQMAYANTSRQMTWQEKMSNTSHQREVKDLIAAGLNPVLSSGGQGAQAYNTSVDSAVNAIGNIQATREAAAATRYAARQSAAATRAAAAAQLEASKYSADSQERMNKLTNTVNWFIHQDSNTGSWSGLLNRVFNRFGLWDTGIRKAITPANSVANRLLYDPSEFFGTPGKGGLTKDNYRLTSAGKQQVNSGLRKLGITVNAANRDLFTKSFVFHDSSALYRLVALIKAKQKSKTSAQTLYR